MKEQWKKFDNDAKLTVNIEEGRPLPIKIEFPISTLILNKDDRCKRLTSVLKVILFLMFSMFLCLMTIYLHALCCSSQLNTEFEKNTYDDSDLIYDNDEKSNFKNKIYQFRTRKGQQPLSNVIDDNVDLMNRHELPTQDSFFSKKKESFFVEEPTFITKPYSNVFLPVFDDNDYFKKSDQDEETIGKNWKQKKKPLFRQTKDIIPIVINKDLNGNEKPENLNLFIKSVDENINEKQIEQFSEQSKENISFEPTTLSDHFFIQLINAIGLDEKSFEKNTNLVEPSIPKIYFEGSDENARDKILLDEDKQIISLEINDSDKLINDVNDKDEMNKENSIDSSMDDNKILKVSELAAYISNYLEPIVGDNQELLKWYYENKNNPNFETDNDPFKVYTAKLLYSTDITEFSVDLEIVLSLLQMNDKFLKELKTFSEKKDMTVNLDDYEPVRRSIIETIVTKLNMNKLIKKDPEILEVFEKMIEAYNKFELSRTNVDLIDDIVVNGNKNTFPEEDPKKKAYIRQSVLDVIKKVDDPDPDVISVASLLKNYENLTEEKNDSNVITKVIVNDESKDEGYVEFSDQTPINVTEKLTDTTYKTEMELTRVEDVMPVDLEQENLEKKIENDVNENEEVTNMNDFLKIYGDNYDY